MANEQRLRCLVVGKVGNEEVLAYLISEMLESMGHSVERVGSGKEAISRFNGDRFDVVLIDGQDRLEVARAIKDTAPTTRVILMTGNDRLLEADGVDAILHKPFANDELLEAVSLSG